MRRAGPAFLLASAALAVGDPAPPPAPAPDPTIAAKQDLADIRAPAAQGDGAAALPLLNLQDLGPLPGSPAPSPLTPDLELGTEGPKKKKPGTGNWLVDAMDKAETDAKAGAHTARGKDREREEQLKTELEVFRGDEKALTPAEKDLLAVETGSTKGEMAAPLAPAYNPLDAFMASWISARDHDLLLPTKGTDAAHGSSDLAMELGPSGLDGLAPPPEASGVADLKAAPNPYLAELDLVPPPAANYGPAPAPAFGPADLGEPARLNAFSGAEPRPLDNAHPAIPDFAQPSEDDKYFPQLKRF